MLHPGFQGTNGLILGQVNRNWGFIADGDPGLQRLFCCILKGPPCSVVLIRARESFLAIGMQADCFSGSRFNRGSFGNLNASGLPFWLTPP